MNETHHVTLPEQDVEKRLLFQKLFGWSKAMTYRMTTEEMQEIAISRGLMERVK